MKETQFSPEVAQRIKELAVSSPTAKVAFAYFAQRVRTQDKVDLRRFRSNLLKEGHKVDRAELRAVFKGLEKLKLGRYIEGRPGTSTVPNVPDKFEWHVYVPSVGRIAAEVLNLPHRTAQSVVAGHHPIDSIELPHKVMIALSSGQFAQLCTEGVVTHDDLLQVETFVRNWRARLAGNHAKPA